MAVKDPYQTHLLAARCAAVASIGAATIHLGVIPVHWQQWLLSGLFLAAVAAFEFGWGFLVWSRPTAALLAVGIFANIGVAALWVVSRTGGFPFGPHAGLPEPVDAAGICVLLLQSYAVMGAVWAWLRRDGSHFVSAISGGLVLIGAHTVMAVAVMMGLASSLQDPGHHPDAVTAHRVTAPPSGRVATGGLPVTDMARHNGDHRRDHG